MCGGRNKRDHAAIRTCQIAVSRAGVIGNSPGEVDLGAMYAIGRTDRHGREDGADRAWQIRAADYARLRINGQARRQILCLKVTFVPKALLNPIARLALLKYLPIWLLGFTNPKSDTTVHEKLAEAVPVVSLTVTLVLKTVLSATRAGTVPEMTPDCGSIESPVGKPEAEKVRVPLPPVTWIVSGVIGCVLPLT